MKRSKLYIAIFCLLLLACSRKVAFVHNSGSRLSWGIRPERNGQSSEILTPPLEQQWMYRLNSSPGQSLVAADSIIAFGSKDGKIHLVDMTSGKGRQILKDREKIETTCVLTDSLLIIVKRIGYNSLRAVSLLDQSNRWSVNAGSIEGEPLVLYDKIVVGSDESNVRCFEIQTGKSIWKRKLSGRVRGSLASDKEMIYAVTDDHRIWSLSALTGEKIWQKDLDGTPISGAVISGKTVFTGCTNGWIGAFQTPDGQMLWETQVEGGIFSTPATEGTALYFGTSQGKLYALNMQNGKTIWQSSISGVFGSSPLLSGTTLYIGALNKQILAFNCQSGEELWKAELRGRIRTTPVIWKGMLIIGTEGRSVYGFVPES
ncbi:PQQ-binding-like beta-propeller repeat protein [candidate division KSB1 bacterium]|nr:PQQ-binding-like beta-propeller repeat protein [candidate division KSB1 bacterium]